MKDRLLKTIEYFYESQAKFAKHIGETSATVNNWVKGERGIGNKVIEKIAGSMPDLNLDWLLTGEGQMLKSDSQDDGYFYTKSGVRYQELSNGKYKMTVQLVPQEASAKYLDEVIDVDISTVETYDFMVDKIGLGRYMAFRIKGDSMDDDSKRSISEGDVVLARELGRDHWRNKLHINKRPFWIITSGCSILCKEIIVHDVENGEILCHSLNPSPQYSDFSLKLSEVSKLYNIIQRVSSM